MQPSPVHGCYGFRMTQVVSFGRYRLRKKQGHKGILKSFVSRVPFILEGFIAMIYTTIFLT